MTAHRELFAALAAPFEPEEVKLRTQAGRQMHYVTSRTVMNRLDEVLGPENWWDDYAPGEHSVICRLTIRLPDGQVLTKADAGGYAGMADPGDDDKSGFSDAFKRAAVKFGVGRYLYRDGIPRFARDAIKDQGQVDPPRRQDPPPAAAPPRDGNGKAHGEPKTGRALFAWLSDKEKEHVVALIKPMNAWGKKRGLHWKMTEWPDDVIAEAHGKACQIIGSALVARSAATPATAQVRNEPVTQEEVDGWGEGRE